MIRRHNRLMALAIMRIDMTVKCQQFSMFSKQRHVHLIVTTMHCTGTSISHNNPEMHICDSTDICTTVFPFIIRWHIKSNTLFYTLLLFNVVSSEATADMALRQCW